MHKCTGIHAKVLCKDGAVDYKVWPRLATGGDFGPIVESLDAEVDVLLFPCDEATPVQHFPWKLPNTTGMGNEDKSLRLIILKIKLN